ncbi:MAG: glycogen/starch synthase [Verrucomicrobiota bacterium]
MPRERKPGPAKEPAAKKTAAKKSSAKPAAKKAPAKKSPRKPTAKKTPAKKASTKGAAAKKPTAKRASAKETGPSQPEAKRKPAAKKKPVAKRAAKKKATGTRRAAVGAVERVEPAKLHPPGLKIMFVSAECAPFAKVGGLADAVAGLAKAVARRGHQVRIVMPLYAQVDYARHGLAFRDQACIHLGGGEENWIGVHEALLDGQVPVWFVDHGRFFQRAGVYDEGPEYDDNAYRFGLLGKAALQLAKDFDFAPDVMHLHDWAAAPAAAFLKTWDRTGSPLSATASVLTIHNIGHQGKYHAGAMAYYGLGPVHFTADKFEDFGMMNLLKAGVHFADAITTVSPRHAEELKESVGGHGLAPMLNDRADRLTGILNGVDTDHWDPASDPFLPATYGPGNLGGKAICKRELQARFGLPADPSQPVFAVISRFAHQKGLGLLFEGLPRLLHEGSMQFVVLGNGDRDTEDFFNWLRAEHSDKAGVYIGYHNELAHLIEAGADFFVMPSLYEPCGLNQIYSLRYGTIPIVRATGGLDDTITAFDPETLTGTGLKFADPEPWQLEGILRYARDLWWNEPQAIAALRAQGMAAAFPWDTAAQAYETVYTQAKTHRAAWV